MKPFALLAALVLPALLAACGPSNTVRLQPLPPQESVVLPAPSAPRVTVVAFDDKRQDQTSIGTRRDGSAFVTSDNVAQWVSKGLADELTRSGMQVSYALGVAEARRGNPDFLVTGQIDEAMLRETSATDMAATLHVSYAVANRQARLLRESPSASQTRTGLPSAGIANSLLLDTLKDLVRPMSKKIVQTIEKK